jgi:hypothetical protein
MRTTMLMAVFLAAPLFAHAETFAIDRGESVFAIATQRAGIAGRMAHDHLVIAGQYEYELSVDEGAIEGISFSFTAKADDLAIDKAQDLERWWPRLREKGLVERDASSFSERERRDVREAMLGEDQLDASNHPEITAEVLEITANADGDQSHAIRVAITVTGETVEYAFPATISLDDGALTLEAHAIAKFTDFGIRPYRAMLGAVRNQDAFIVYVQVKAARE